MVSLLQIKRWLSISLHDYEWFYQKKIVAIGPSYWSALVLGIEASQQLLPGIYHSHILAYRLQGSDWKSQSIRCDFSMFQWYCVVRTSFCTGTTHGVVFIYVMVLPWITGKVHGSNQTYRKIKGTKTADKCSMPLRPIAGIQKAGVRGGDFYNKKEIPNGQAFTPL